MLMSVIEQYLELFLKMFLTFFIIAFRACGTKYLSSNKSFAVVVWLSWEPLCRAMIGDSVLSLTESSRKVIKLSLENGFEGISWGEGGVSESSKLLQHWWLF